MVPRPRNKSNKGLPQNLYLDDRRGTYRYRRPTDGKWFQFGTDRVKAVDAAKQLNLAFMQGADLVGVVLGESAEMFTAFLDDYEKNVLPPRELSKGTLGLYAVHFRRFRREFEGRAVDQISIRMIAQMLDLLTPRTANQCRALLIDIFNHAAAKGLCPDNPAASTINRIEKKTRKRHTVDGLKAIREGTRLAAKCDRSCADHCSAPHRYSRDEVRRCEGRLSLRGAAKDFESQRRGVDQVQGDVRAAARVSHCRDNVVCPFLVHRRPDRKRQKQAETKEHWTKVEERYLTRAFKDAREAADCYKGWKEEMPGFTKSGHCHCTCTRKPGKMGRRSPGTQAKR